MGLKDIIPIRKKDISGTREEEHPLATLRREMDRIFDSFTHRWELGAFPELPAAFSPRMDMSEDAKAFTATVELPGMTEKDIDVSIAGDTLTIRGEKKEDKEEKNKNYYYSERSYGSFSRTIPLPGQIEADKISANFKKGVLTITLPKSAAAIESQKKISVKTE